MKILFSMQNFWYVKTFDLAIRELAARGHQIHLAADFGRGDSRIAEWNRAAEELAATVTGVTYGWSPPLKGNMWLPYCKAIRFGLDYMRFLHPRYRESPKLGVKARRRVPGVIRLASSLDGPRGRDLLERILRELERAIPIDPRAFRFLCDYRPDLVLLTPLVNFGSLQTDLIRGARSLRIPVGLCVGSWDHLSSKALIRAMPDFVCVWNDVQRLEAEEMHGVEAERVMVTGAQCFDHWFEYGESESRECFCRRVGLDAREPYVMYACTALLRGSPVEAEFVIRWIETLRHTPGLERVGVLIRPHPKRGAEWHRVDLSRFENVVLWPREAGAPINEAARHEYFHSIKHSTAVVGLNTTALIEAAIVGRPVLSPMPPEFRDSQEGTLHFHYLLTAGGGILRTARTLTEHAAQVLQAVRGPAEADQTRREAFLRAFIRPMGLRVAASHTFAEVIEHAPRLSSVGPEPRSLLTTLLLIASAPLAYVLHEARQHKLRAARARRRAAKVEHRRRRLEVYRRQRLEPHREARRERERAEAGPAGKVDEARQRAERYAAKAEDRRQRLEAHRQARRSRREDDPAIP